MKYKIITKSSAIIAIAVLLTPRATSLAENVSLDTEKIPTQVTSTNSDSQTTETTNKTQPPKNPEGDEFIIENKLESLNINETEIAKAATPLVDFENDVPTSYISSSTGISFNWNLETKAGQKEVRAGDKIVLSISG